MRKRIAAVMLAALPVSLWLCLAGTPAQAQILDSLKSAVGGGQGGSGSSGGASGGLGSLGSLMGGGSSSAVSGASNKNIAGVLTYCMKNNYLGGGGVSSVKSNLLGKLGGGATDSNQYSEGEQGKLQSGKQSFSLGGAGSGGLKQKVTQKVCDQVLKHAKSLI